MSLEKFTRLELENIQKYFGKSLSELNIETSRKIRTQLRAKYHPDKFEKYADETVKEMMHEHFRELEALFKKMEQYFETNDTRKPGNETIYVEQPFLHPNAQYE